MTPPTSPASSSVAGVGSLTDPSLFLQLVRSSLLLLLLLPPSLLSIPLPPSSSILVLATYVCWSKLKDEDQKKIVLKHMLPYRGASERRWFLLPPLSFSLSGRKNMWAPRRPGGPPKRLPACWGNWSAGGSAPVSCCSQCRKGCIVVKG